MPDTLPSLHELIDDTINQISQRKLVSSDEMVDLLLDIRLLTPEGAKDE